MQRFRVGRGRRLLIKGAKGCWVAVHGIKGRRLPTGRRGGGDLAGALGTYHVHHQSDSLARVLAICVSGAEVKQVGP